MYIGGKKDILDIVSNHSEQSTATTYDPNSEETTNNECDDYDEDNFETAIESFEAYTSKAFKDFSFNDSVKVHLLRSFHTTHKVLL